MSRGRRALLYGAIPLAALAALMAMLFVEHLEVLHDVQLQRPPEARAGEVVPLVAFVIGGIGEIEGPRLVPAEARFRLTTADGHRVEASAPLDRRPSVAVRVPDDARFPLEVAVETFDAGGDRLGGAHAEVREASGAGSPRALRRAHELARLALGPVLTEEGEVPPSHLELRVLGGASRAEDTAEILVHVGQPPARIELEAEGGFVIAEPPPSREAEGLVPLTVRLTGPAPSGELRASRMGRVVARRHVRLPIALATPSLRVERRILSVRAARELAVDACAGSPDPCYVDAFRDGRWQRSASRANGAVAFDPPLDAGLWWLQARQDPFSGSPASARLLLVQGDAAEVPDLVGLAASLGVDPPPIDVSPELAFAYLAAAVEEERHPLPAAVSGYGAAEAEIAEIRRIIRLAAGVTLALGLFALVLLYLRRGARATLEAERLMNAFDEPEPSAARRRRRIETAALVFASLALFLGVALLVVLRLHLLE